MGYELMEVLEEHLDEAEFLWSLWERSILSPVFDLDETSIEEERLRAHLDALMLARAVASDELLLPALEMDEGTRLSAAAFALLEATRTSGVQRVLERLKEGSQEQRAALGRALELSESPVELLLPLSGEAEPELQVKVLEVLGFHARVTPELVTRFLRHEDSRVKAAALRGASGLPGAVRREELVGALSSDDPALRNAAIKVGLSWGLRAAWQACLQAIEAGGEGCREPMVLLAMGGDERDIEPLIGLLARPRMRHHALWALGFSGQVRAAEACFQWMSDAPVAPLAAEAFCAITGLTLDDRHRALDDEEPVEEPIPLEQEDLDADLLPKPEDELPGLNPEAAAGWWHAHRARFNRGARYLRGRPLDGSVLLDSLLLEPMRRRHVLADELTIRSRGMYRVQTRTWTWLQRAQVCAASASRDSLSMLPLARLTG